MKRFLSCLALACLSMAPSAFAQNQLDDIVRLEVLDGGETDTGMRSAGLRLTLAQGWRTYWRAPGDAGIPPQFQWRGARNLANVRAIWPTPEIFRENGMRSIGYSDQLILPLEVEAQQKGQPVRLKGQINIGICQDICIPATLNIDAVLDGTGTRSPAIAAALAAQPFTEREAGVVRAVCDIEPTQHGLKLTTHVTMPSAGGREEAVIEAGDQEIWVSEPVTERRGNVLTATSELIHTTQTGGYAIQRSQVRITIIGSNHAVDILGCDAP